MAARLRAAIAVDAQLQVQAVNVIGDRLDAVRESQGVGLQRPVRVARRVLDRPAIVDVDVLVAGVAHAGRHHRVGRALDEVLVDVALELVPAVPAHRRQRRHAGDLHQREVVVLLRLRTAAPVAAAGAHAREQAEKK